MALPQGSYLKRKHQVSGLPAQYLFSLYAALVLIAHTPYARVENLHVKWNGLLVVHHSRQFQFLLQTLAGLGEI